MVQAQAFTKLQSASQRILARCTGGLVAAIVGTTNDAVLNFANAPQTLVGSAEYITAANSATLGTSVVLRMPGIYWVRLHAQIIADAVIPVFGISQDVAAAGLTTGPAFATAGMVAVESPVNDVTTAAGVIATQNIGVMVEVNDVQAQQVVGGITGSIIRFHAATAAGATPANGIQQATAYYEIRRIGPAYAA